MIIADCRAGIGGSVVFSRNVEWSGGELAELRGKRVLVCTHGVKNSRSQIERAYSEIFNRSRASFDALVGYIWPSGVTPLGWPIASAFAVERGARHLATVLNTIREAGAATIDADAHSLGCPITMEALKELHQPIDGVWLMAPAQGRNLERYRSVVAGNVRGPVHVFHSKRDYVLSVLFQIYPPFKPALGAWGESTPGGNLAISHDCTKDVGANHTGYRRISRIVQEQTNETARREHTRRANAEIGLSGGALGVTRLLRRP